MNPSTYLLIETSSSIFYVAVWIQNDHIWHPLPEYEWAIKINPTIQFLKGNSNVFNNCNFSKDNWLYNIIKYSLDGLNINKFNNIIIGEGPGSFTALRISHTFIRTLGVLWNSNIYKFSSILFWRQVFKIPNDTPFLFQINKNLYYGDIEAGKEILSKTKNEWISLLSKKPYIWLIPFINKPNQINVALNADWNNAEIINENNILNFTLDFSIFNLEEHITWNSLFPLYGHEII